MKHPMNGSKAVIFESVPQYDDAQALNAVEKIFAACACTKTLGASTKVLLKPNLLAKHAPDAAVTTHPCIVKAVITALRARGVQDITLADSSGGVYNAAMISAVYKASGLAAVCEQQGVHLYTDCRAGAVACEGALVHSFNIIEPAQDADFIIDLCKLKTHAMTGLTCAVKNMFGVIPGLQKAELHMRFPQKEHFGDMLVDLCECVRPSLVIVDGVVGMEGDGPSGGSPREVGLVFGGENPYSVDLFAARLIGIDPMRVPYLARAYARGLCENTFDAALCAEPLPAPVADYQLPSSYEALETDFATRFPKPLQGFATWGRRLIAPHPHINTKKCIGCGKCAEICPASVITVTDKKAHIAPRACIRCFCCHEMCPVKAIDIRHFGAFRL